MTTSKLLKLELITTSKIPFATISQTVKNQDYWSNQHPDAKGNPESLEFTGLFPKYSFLNTEFGQFQHNCSSHGVGDKEIDACLSCPSGHISNPLGN